MCKSQEQILQLPRDGGSDEERSRPTSMATCCAGSESNPDGDARWVALLVLLAVACGSSSSSDSATNLQLSARASHP
jgi:hypothetical protein